MDIISLESRDDISNNYFDATRTIAIPRSGAKCIVPDYRMRAGMQCLGRLRLHRRGTVAA